MRTEAERHRDIIGHCYLIPMLASGYRGVRGIPFEELEGAGMVGLVEAANDWNGSGTFAQFANVAIRNQIKDFIRDWDAPKDPEQVSPGSDDSLDFYIWQNWSDREFIYAISEYWEGLMSSPADIVEAFDKVKRAGAAIRSAAIGFSRRERNILNARFFTSPPSSIETIARHHKISYARAVFLIDRMLNKIRKILESREAATPTAARG